MLVAGAREGERGRGEEAREVKGEGARESHGVIQGVRMRGSRTPRVVREAGCPGSVHKRPKYRCEYP